EIVLLLKKIVLACLLAPAFASAAPVTLVLTNGDRLQGDLLSRNQETLTIKHQLLGEMVISTKTVAQIKTDYEALAQQAPQTEKAAAEEPTVEPAGLVQLEPEDDGLFGTGWLADWE